MIPQFDTFVQTAQDVRRVIGNSPKLLQEFDRAQAARTANAHKASPYLMMNPHPWMPEERGEDGFSHLVAHVGPDVWRMRAVGDLLFGNSVQVLPVGGSCAIETWGMRLIERERRDPQNIAKLAERLLAMAPTFTHATGALLTGAHQSVHFIEDRLWAARLQEWGVDRAHAQVLEAYERIQAVVERRAKLIQPTCTVAPIHFDDLGLRDGPIARWFGDMRLPDDPSFGIAEVLYTYCGPELRDLVVRQLDRMGYAWASKITHVVRLKQIDHNDWDSTLSEEAKAIVLNQGLPPDEASFPVRAAIAIAQWVRKHHKANASQVAGFFDIPYGAAPLHMVSKLPAVDGSTDAQLASPARLWHGNLDAHLAYMRSGLQRSERNGEEINLAHAKNDKQQRIKTEQRHARAVQQCEKKQSELAEHLCVLTFLRTFKEGESFSRTDNDATIRLLLDRIARHLRGFENRELTDMDRRDVTQLHALKEDLQRSSWRPYLWLDMVTHYEQEREAAVARVKNAINACEQERASAQRELAALEPVPQSRAHERSPTMQLYPLQSNLFICYATQFLFDPDFRRFLQLIGDIQDTDLPRSEKQERIRQLCEQIYPKLEAYLHYIMQGGAYPHAVRESRTF